MLKNFFRKPPVSHQSTFQVPEGQRLISEEDYQRYRFYEELLHKIFDTEAALHNIEDPTEIAIGVMKAACDLYDGDWSGILIADMHSQVWRPEMWFDIHTGPMTETLFYDFEMTEDFATWVRHLIEQKPLIIPDVEAIKESSPKEYEAYQRLDTHAVIGVPFGQHPLGFMVVRNPKKNIEHYQTLQIACFVAMMMVEQKRRLDAERRYSADDCPDNGKTHIRYNILGQHDLEINGRHIREHDLEHPNRRGWIILLYLVLHGRPVDLSVLASEQWPDEADVAFKRNTKQATFRLHNDLAVYHDVKVVDAKTGILSLSDDVRVTTDADEMERLYSKAISTANEDEKMDLLKRAFALYRGRVFEDGESELGGWIIEYMTHYNQVFINITRELLSMLGHHKDYPCIVEYGAKAIRIEPGIQDAYYWTVQAANHMGNTAARDKCLEMARDALTEEEYLKLLQLLNLPQE